MTVTGARQLDAFLLSREWRDADDGIEIVLWARAKERARGFVAEGDTEAEKQLGEEILRAALPAGVESSKDVTSRQVDGVLERIAGYVLNSSPDATSPLAG